LLSLAEFPRSQRDFARTRALWEEALALFREVGDTPYVGWLLYLLGNSARLEGDFTRATALLEESLMLSERVGNKNYVARTLISSGRLAIVQGHHAQAEALFDKSAGLFREFGFFPGHLEAPLPFINLGHLALSAGDQRRAISFFKEGLLAAQAAQSKG